MTIRHTLDDERSLALTGFANRHGALDRYSRSATRFFWCPGVSRRRADAGFADSRLSPTMRAVGSCASLAATSRRRPCDVVGWMTRRSANSPHKALHGITAVKATAGFRLFAAQWRGGDEAAADPRNTTLAVWTSSSRQHALVVNLQGSMMRRVSRGPRC